MCLRPEEPLDDPVLERVEADDGDPAAWCKHLERCGQGGLESAKLVVDGDPERLEDPPGRMPVPEPGRRRDRGLDRLHELPVVSNGCSRRSRTMRFAICRA